MSIRLKIIKPIFSHKHAKHESKFDAAPTKYNFMEHCSFIHYNSSARYTYKILLDIRFIIYLSPNSCASPTDQTDGDRKLLKPCLYGFVVHI